MASLAVRPQYDASKSHALQQLAACRLTIDIRPAGLTEL
jgi:hypothetical protein